MIKMWVLLIAGQILITGYPSEKECKEAAAYAPAASSKQCIPAPASVGADVKILR